MFGNRTLNRLNQMLDEALDGTFREEKYDETKLSRLETKWKRFLNVSCLSRETMEKEKENVKSLVTDLSHQIKTPMTNIKLYASLLEETLQAERTMEHKEDSLLLLNELVKQSDKLEFLIQSLTKMSRLESNIITVEPKEQPVKGLIEETVEEARVKAGQKRIEITDSSGGKGWAYYDMKWTKEALGNVLDNAVKYSPSGSQIVISVTEYEIYTAISVKDEGIGIHEEDLPRIFGRFYRAQDVNQEDGVGIGLYLSREILKKEAGYMKVKSAYGEGSEFILYLQKNAL